MALEGLKFLYWGYFNLLENESKDDIVKRCIDLAYVDATNQGSFNTRADDTARLSSAYNHICEAILSTLIFNYDEWHDNLCRQLLDDYKDIKNRKTGQNAFTYGNAQKWVNMSVKYLYLIRSIVSSFSGCSVDFCNFYDEKFKPHEDEFHVPIDSFIIEAIWPIKAISGECDWLPGAKFTRNNHPYLGPYKSDHCKAWSNFNDTEYFSVRDHVRTLVKAGSKKPLEWENEEWINIAKKRKT